MQIALKIDIDTFRGTREGLPGLVESLQRHHAQATFLFSLGPDHTGRALRRALRPGFLSKVSRTSVVEHYGVRTLLYGTLLPGPDIGRVCAPLLRQVRDAGFETGIHTWDHVRWQDFVAHRDAAWTQAEMQAAHNRYAEIFGEAAQVHGAAGWQMNAHAYRCEQSLAYRYASDGRGQGPFMPVVDGVEVPVPQLPTTLPTLDEVVGLDGITADNVHEHLLALTQASSTPQVFTLHAELEGMKWRPIFERLLEGWTRQGHQLCSMRQMLDTLEPGQLPRHVAETGSVPGRSGVLAIQGQRVG